MTMLPADACFKIVHEDLRRDANKAFPGWLERVLSDAINEENSLKPWAHAFLRI